MWAAAERRPYLALALLALALFLPGLFTLPPIDRDEARFAQASKQMLETGDFVDIRFQAEPRHKKPVGIYWLQAAAAGTLGTPPYDAIGLYRLPSLIGALFAVLLTYWAGRPLLGSRAALIGAALLAGTVLLAAEARLAKTDAVLLATIMAAQGALARVYLGRGVSWTWGVFWAALGIGVLIKGPVGPLVSGLTIIALAIADRSWRWVMGLRPALGLPLLLLIALPWGIAIHLATDGQFFSEALRGDMASKLVGGQESHGAPPGYYLVLSVVTFWPGTLILLPALGQAIATRAEPAMRFLLAASLPVWLFFELVPTKLPHYVLPAYPALALLCGWALSRPAPTPRLLRGLAVAGFVATALAFAALLARLRQTADGASLPVDYAAAVLVIAAMALTLWRLRHKHLQAAAAAALVTSFAVTASAFGHLAPSLSAPWIAPRLVAQLPRTPEGRLPPLITSGFSEPSLVFLAGTGTRIAVAADAATALRDTPGAVAAISTQNLSDFLAAAHSHGLTISPIATVSGFNYSVGKPVTLTLYRRTP